MSEMLYLAWQLDLKQPLARQIAEAQGRFEARLGRAPTELLAAPGSTLECPGLIRRESRNVPPGQVWLGANMERTLASTEEAA